MKDSLDDLLADIKAEYLGTGQKDPIPPVRQDPSGKPLPQGSRPTEPDLADLLRDIAHEYQAQDLAMTRQQAERQAGQEIEQQRYWHEKAQKWLKQLDPQSFEAEWFAVFAQKHPNQLEAAISYVRGMSQINPHFLDDL